jgi:hypothetical protein
VADRRDQRGAGSAPTYIYRAPGDVSAPVADTSSASKCHSSDHQPPGQTDLAVRFAATTPRTTRWKRWQEHNVNASARRRLDRLPDIASCHTSDNTSVRTLTAPVAVHPQEERAAAARTPPLSHRSHRYDTYANDGASTTLKAYSRLNPPGFARGHTYHVGNRRYPCYACHESHGSTTGPHLMINGRTPGLNNYTESPTGGTCSPTCHGSRSYTINYPR